MYRQAKLFLQEFDRSRARFALNLPRKDFRILVGLLTGHADFNRHLHIMGHSRYVNAPDRLLDSATLYEAAGCLVVHSLVRLRYP